MTAEREGSTIMHGCGHVKIRKSAGAGLKKFCDMVGLVVLNAVDQQPEDTSVDETTFIVESATDSTPVGCCRIDEFAEDGNRCSVNYYLCKQYEYNETYFSGMLFSVLRAVFREYPVAKIVCKPVKRMYQRQRFFPESGFVVEVLYACVNPNGEYLVDENYVIYREEFEKRYGY